MAIVWRPVSDEAATRQICFSPMLSFGQNWTVAGVHEEAPTVSSCKPPSDAERTLSGPPAPNWLRPFVQRRYARATALWQENKQKYRQDWVFRLEIRVTVPGVLSPHACRGRKARVDRGGCWRGCRYEWSCYVLFLCLMKKYIFRSEGLRGPIKLFQSMECVYMLQFCLRHLYKMTKP